MPSARRRGVAAGRRQGPVRLPRAYRDTFDPPYNAANRLPIPSPIAGANAMHPDVVDFGTAWHGYRYWMAFTPYNGVEDTEVPSVVACNDLTGGGTWVVPSGFTNPLTEDQAGVTHMADTDLCYDAAADRLYVFYVVTDGSTYQDIRAKWTAGDGTWSSEITVLSGGGYPSYVNPSIIKTATGWRLYYNFGFGTIRYRDSTATPATGYGAETVCTLPLDSGRQHQNLNVVRDTDGTIVAIVSDSNLSTVNGRMFFGRSTDGGTAFTVTGPDVLAAGPSANWDAGGIYRASLVVNTSSVVVTSGSSLHLYYSGYRDGVSTWGVGYVQIPAQFIRL